MTPFIVEKELRFGVSVPPMRYTGYRLLHMAEGGDPHYIGAPAVHNSINIAGIPFTRAMQNLSYDINVIDNPNFSGSRWRSVYSNDTAFTNGQGFNKNNDPRADFINGRNTESPLPKIMRGILCSGSFYRGDAVGSELILRPGVHGIDVRLPMPPAQTVIDNNWFFWAINADLVAASHFDQGAGRGARIPIFIRDAARYKLNWFATWDKEVLPDPRVFYLRV